MHYSLIYLQPTTTTSITTNLEKRLLTVISINKHSLWMQPELLPILYIFNYIFITHLILDNRAVMFGYAIVNYVWFSCYIIYYIMTDFLDYIYDYECHLLLTHFDCDIVTYNYFLFMISSISLSYKSMKVVNLLKW